MTLAIVLGAVDNRGMGTFLLAASAATQSAGLAQSHWFTAPVVISCVGVCIALAAFTVAFLNFRLSRFPHVRVKTSIHYSTSNQMNAHEYFFDVEVESWGLPIWDMRVFLQADYPHEDSEHWLGLYQLELAGLNVPKPMNPGQVAKFRTSRTDARSVPGERRLGISDLPPERVSLCIYGSGERLIKRIPAKRFPVGFRNWDSMKPPPPPPPPGTTVETWEVGRTYRKMSKIID